MSCPAPSFIFAMFAVILLDTIFIMPLMPMPLLRRHYYARRYFSFIFAVVFAIFIFRYAPFSCRDAIVCSPAVYALLMFSSVFDDAIIFTPLFSFIFRYAAFSLSLFHYDIIIFFAFSPFDFSYHSFFMPTFVFRLPCSFVEFAWLVFTMVVAFLPFGFHHISFSFSHFRRLLDFFHCFLLHNICFRLFF